MKVAVISDVHGNVPALTAVLADIERFAPDHIVVNGDVVSRGPRSAEVLDRLAAGAAAGPAQWHFTRGNHEDYVAAHLEGSSPDPIAFELRRLSYWTYQQIGDTAARQIAAWPLTVELPEGVRVAHASMVRNDKGIYVESTDDEVRTLMAPAPAVFVIGHTHRPFVRTVDDTLVANGGSVGTPFDGDVRASYVQLEGGPEWRAKLIRVPYDREAAERAFHASGCLDEAGAITRIVFQEWKTATPLTRGWFDRYHDAVKAGSISIEASVDRYLESVG